MLRHSIPVLRGEVQQMLGAQPGNYYCIQFPYCVGKFNLTDVEGDNDEYTFNSRTAWGSSTYFFGFQTGDMVIQFPYCVGKFNFWESGGGYSNTGHSIPVLRGEVQRAKFAQQDSRVHSIPVLRGEVQRYGLENKLPYEIHSIPVLRGEVQR